MAWLGTVGCAAALVACAGGRATSHGTAKNPTSAASAARTAGDTRITLYRDRAVVQQRVVGTLAAGADPVVRVQVARDVAATDIYVIAAAGDAPVSLRATAERGVVELALPGRPPGRFAVQLGYVTAQLQGVAQYTMLTSAAHDRSVLRGAIAIHDTAGVTLAGAHVRLVDTQLAQAAVRSAEQLRFEYTGSATSTTPLALPRDLGIADVTPGETRIELVPTRAAQSMRSVLVFDPIGVGLDHPGREPELDPSYGVQPGSHPRVSESLELPRDATASAGLPGGPVRLFERSEGGELVMLGESRIFDTSTKVAQTDTVEIGTALSVTGLRERRELTPDEDRHRLTEEIRVTLRNDRPAPVEIVVHEHLYRSESWSIAFASHAAAKDGPQQISMRVRVPAHGTATATYVVVYLWEPAA